MYGAPWARSRQSLANSARRFGAEIVTDAEVAQVCVANGRATGVVTTDGREFNAKVVLSNADPVRTYTKLVDSSELPAEFLADIEAIQITSPVMKINMALERLPEYTAAGADQSSGIHRRSLHRTEHRLLPAGIRGRPPRRTVRLSLFQRAYPVGSRPSVAPAGKHTLSIFTQYMPYHLADGTWDERREAIADHVLDRFSDYAPNINEIVIKRQTLAPPDIEARFGLTGGHIFQGELVPEQAFDLRPVPGSASYEGPVAGLYLCGSGAWPGGCVMGAPGHNAAHEAIANLDAGQHRA